MPERSFSKEPRISKDRIGAERVAKEFRNIIESSSDPKELDSLVQELQNLSVRIRELHR